MSGALAILMALRFAELMAAGAPSKALLSTGGGACLLAAISLTLLKNSRQGAAAEGEPPSLED